MLLGTRRPSTSSEAILLALLSLIALATVIYGLSLFFDNVDHQRNLMLVLGIPGVRLLLDLVSVVNSRE